VHTCTQEALLHHHSQISAHMPNTLGYTVTSETYRTQYVMQYTDQTAQQLAPETGYYSLCTLILVCPSLSKDKHAVHRPARWQLLE